MPRAESLAWPRPCSEGPWSPFPMPGVVESKLGVCLTLTDAISRSGTVDDIYRAALDALAEGLGVSRASSLLSAAPSSTACRMRSSIASSRQTDRFAGLKARAGWSTRTAGRCGWQACA